MLRCSFVGNISQKVAMIRSSFGYPDDRKKRQAGFTLVELLTVVSIMTLIGSISLAKVSEARRLAQDTKTIQDMKSIIKVVQAYYLDHGYYPSLTAAEAASPANTYPCGEKICDYYASNGNDMTICNGWNPCRCGTSSATRDQRLKMGWLPMLDGSINPQDTYFSPQSTPRDKDQVDCRLIVLIHMHSYLSFFDLLTGKYSIFMTYILQRPRKNAPGSFLGCSSDFCVYNIKEKDIGL